MKVALLFLSLLLSHSSYAALGTVAGGGGKGVVCRNADDTVASVETLDLWEARTLRNQQPILQAENLNALVDKALVQLANSVPRQMQQGTDPIVCSNEGCTLMEMRAIAKIFFDPKNTMVTRLRGAKLKDTDDALEIAEPEDCKIEQVVNYMPGGQVVVNQDLLDKMDVTNQAALIAHESFYRMLREIYFPHLLKNTEPNSLRVRRAVGYVFSGGEFTFEIPYNGEKGDIACSDDRDYLTFPRDFSTIHFSVVDGSFLLGGAHFTADYPLVMKDLVSQSGKACKGGSFQGTGLDSLPSPVEFDRAFKFFTTCNKGRTAILMTTRAPGKSDLVEHTLHCSVIKK